MAEQRLCTSPIIWQAKRYVGPGDIDPSLLVGSVLNLFYREAVVSGEVLDLLQGHRVHLRARGRRPAPQTDRKQATGPDQRRDFAEGPVSLRWRDVLPDSGQHHDIEADRQRTEDGQFRKLVVDPADAWVGVKALSLTS